MTRAEGFTVIAAACMMMVLAATGAASAHSSTTAQARLDVIVGSDDTVQAIRHVWRFGAEFTETLIDQFDENENEILDPDELDEVSKTIEASIADLGYFQLVTANGKDVPMRAPVQFAADMQEDRLIVLFESRPKDALKLEGTVEIGVFDPTFTTVFDFPRDDYLSIDHMPESCSRAIVRPDVDAEMRRHPKIVEEAMSGDTPDDRVSRIFATRLKIVCPAAGKTQ